MAGLLLSGSSNVGSARNSSSEAMEWYFGGRSARRKTGGQRVLSAEGHASVATMKRMLSRLDELELEKMLKESSNRVMVALVLLKSARFAGG